MKIEELKKIIVKIEHHKAKIAKERNLLREILEDLEDCIESFNEGIEGLADGLVSIENAIDSISEYV